MTNQTHTEPTHKPTPSGIKAISAYLAGLVIGGLLIMPAAEDTILTMFTNTQLDATGRSLLLGLLMLFIVSLGLFTLFQIFIFLDR